MRGKFISLKIFTVLTMAIMLFFSACHGLTSTEIDDGTAGVLKFDSNHLELDIGEMAVLKLTAEKNQNSAAITWECAGNAIKIEHDNYGAVITAQNTGEEIVTASCGGRSVKCVVTVSNFNYAPKIENPYVYASEDVVNLSVGETTSIFASAYGGSKKDNEYSWNCDKPGVAEIVGEGAYCRIRGIMPGQAKITVRNPSVSTVPYSVLINVTGENLKTPYITTEMNVVTLNLTDGKSEQFEVRMENAPAGGSDNALYTFSLLDENENEISQSQAAARVTGMGKSFLVEPVSVGTFIIRVAHPDAPYDTDIIVRVGIEASLAYVALDKKVVTLTDENSSVTVEASLISPERTSENTSEFEWTAQSGANEILDWHISGGNNRNTGNILVLKPKKNGVAKFVVRYPSKTDTAASVVVIVKEMAREAKNAEAYITTSQNYIKAYKNGDNITINVDLLNIPAGEENKMHWSIENDASSGKTNEKVISWISGTGSFSEKFKSRSAIAVFTSGHSIIKPENPGTATITMTHPMAMYPTIITVKVAPENEKRQSPPWYLSSDLSWLCVSKKNNIDENGDITYSDKTVEFELILTGEGVTDADYNNIRWEFEDPLAEQYVNLELNGKKISAKYTGTSLDEEGRTTIIFSHPKTSQKFRLPVTYALNEGYALNKKVLYATSAQNIVAHTNEQLVLNVEVQAFEETDIITWETNRDDIICFTEYNRNRKTAVIMPLKTGDAVVTAKCGNIGTAVFNITVETGGRENDYEESYINCAQTSVYFEQPGQEKTITISPVNMNMQGISEIKWQVWETNGDGLPAYDEKGQRIPSENFSVTKNMTTGILTAEKDLSEAVLSISHPLSENEIFVSLRCGNKYEYKPVDYAFIQADTELIELKLGGTEKTVSAVLAHTLTGDLEKTGFSFELSKPGIVNIEEYGNTCILSPKKPGTTTLLINNINADDNIATAIPVIVSDRDNPEKVPFLTTQSNVVNIISGETAPITVQLVNGQSNSNSDWTWKITDESICGFSATSAGNAVIKAKKTGATEITVKNRYAEHPLKIIVIVSDARAVKTSPYIMTTQNIITLAPSQYKTINAEVLGGTDCDKYSFVYTSSDPAVAVAQGNGSECRITALKKGQATISIENIARPELYPKSVLVIVRETVNEDCEITVESLTVTIEPDAKKTKTVRAELLNGDSTDPMDFTWWLDDKTFADIRTSAGECEIRPRGKSGITKLHIAHPKVIQDKEITLCFSKYDTFDFLEKTLTLVSGNVAFIKMAIPTQYEKAEIKFSSTNNDLVTVTRAGNICMLLANPNELTGDVIVTAELTVDKKRAATAECYVSVVSKNYGLANITPEVSMLVMEKGDEKFITATVDGNNLPGNAADKLRWQIVSDKNDGLNDSKGLDILQNNGASATGPVARITACEPGDHIIKLFYMDELGHELGASYIRVMVPDRSDMAIILSQTSGIYYRDKPAFEITAELYNAPSGAEKEIRWTVEQNDSNRILSVSDFESASTGPKCAFKAINVGTCVVRATYKNVTQSCFITVKNTGTINISTRNVTTYPNGTERVYYSVEPEGATVTWLASMNNSSSNFAGATDDAFSFVDNPVDGYLEVTGIRDCGQAIAGTIQGILNTTSAYKVELSVKVNYDSDITLVDQNYSTTYAFVDPDPAQKTDLKELEFTIFPADLDVDWQKCIDNNANLKGNLVVMQTISSLKFDEEQGRNLRVGKIILKTLAEYPEETVTFIAKAEGLPSQAIIKKTFCSYYQKYNFQWNWELKSGTFSYFNNDHDIHLGDGEEMVCRVTVTNPLAKPKKLKVKIDPVINGSGSAGTMVVPDEKYWAGSNYGHNTFENKNNTKGLLRLNGSAQNTIDLEFDEKKTATFTLSHAMDVFSDMAVKNYGQDGQSVPQTGGPIYVFNNGSSEPFYDWNITKDMKCVQKLYGVSSYTKHYCSCAQYRVTKHESSYDGSIYYSSERVQQFSFCPGEGYTGSGPSSSDVENFLNSTRYLKSESSAYHEIPEKEGLYDVCEVHHAQTDTYYTYSDGTEEKTYYPSHGEGWKNWTVSNNGRSDVSEDSTSGYWGQSFVSYHVDTYTALVGRTCSGTSGVYGFTWPYFGTTFFKENNEVSLPKYGMPNMIWSNKSVSSFRNFDSSSMEVVFTVDRRGMTYINECLAKQLGSYRTREVSYDKITPYVVTDSGFKNNANYYIPGFTAKYVWQEEHTYGGVFQEDGAYSVNKDALDHCNRQNAYHSISERVLHQYATKTTIKDTSVRERVGARIYLYCTKNNALGPSNNPDGEGKLIVDVRYCRAYDQMVLVPQNSRAMKKICGGSVTSGTTDSFTGNRYYSQNDIKNLLGSDCIEKIDGVWQLTSYWR